MKRKTLFSAWAVLFIVCAFLGFIRDMEGAPEWLLTVFSLLFFIPPSLLLWQAKKDGDDRLRLLIRNLAGLSLGLTALGLVLNVLSVMATEALGLFLHCLLTVVSTPMICSGYWALSIFLWAYLFIAALKK